jgi:HD superfamily phosphohydrolase
MLKSAVQTAVADGAFALRDVERDSDDQLLWRLRTGGGTPARLVDELDRRRLYKRAWEGRPADHAADGMAGLVGDASHVEAVQREIAEAAGVAPHEALLDRPPQPRFRELDLQVRRRDGTLLPLRQASQLVHALDAARMDHWRIWVFAPRDRREQVASAAARVLGAPATRP